MGTQQPIATAPSTFATHTSAFFGPLSITASVALNAAGGGLNYYCVRVLATILRDAMVRYGTATWKACCMTYLRNICANSCPASGARAVLQPRLRSSRFAD
jgi:hypothetical protein